MGDAALAILGTAVNASMTLMEGRAAFREEASLRQQLKLDKNQARLAATEEEIVRLQDLNMTQSMTRASMSAAGRGALSPGSSTAALLKFNRQQADRDVKNIVLNRSAEEARIQNEIRASKRRGRMIRAQTLLKLVKIGAGHAQGSAATQGPTTSTGRVDPTGGGSGGITSGQIGGVP